jgi:hypothetical protein
MIIVLPIMLLLIRVIVIRMYVVPLTSADQIQLYASGMINCLIAAVLSAFFDRARDASQPVPSALIHCASAACSSDHGTNIRAC